MKAQPRFVFWAIVAAAILFVVAIPTNAILEFEHAYKSFPERHQEVTAFIEGVYGYFVEKGKWPDAATAAAKVPLPAEWEYRQATDPSDPKTTPTLYLLGPYHMSLVYYFAPPQNGAVNATWRRGIEGDNSEFNAEVPYVVPNGKPSK